MNLSLDVKRYEKDRWYLFALFCLLNILFLYLINDVIITDPQYFTGGNENSVKLFRKVYTAIYFINPIFLLVKTIFFTLIIKLGAALYSNLQLEFRQVFSLIVLSGFILLLPDLLEVIWFLLIHTDYTMKEVRIFFPFSLFSLFNPEELEDSYCYILKLINPFEMMYWFFLTIGLVNLGAKSKLQGFKIIAGSYGLFLLIVILFIWVIYSTILKPA